MAVARGSKTVRRQTVRMARAAEGQHYFVVKTWQRRRWLTIAYRKTRQDAEAFVRQQVFQEDQSLSIFFGGRKIRQWKGTMKITCPCCQWSGGVPIERTQGGWQ